MPKRDELPPGVQPEFFPQERRIAPPAGAPLAARMRPRTLEEYQGQDHIVGPGGALRRFIEGDELPSIILWGPPGCGKTTLANIIANHTQRHFEELSAVTSGVADVRRVVKEAADRLRISGRRTILFVDELHRFNRTQQDGLLPHVEAGTVTLIGATTENPSFYVVAPLLSRCRVFRLELLQPSIVESLMMDALRDEERGLGSLHITIDNDALDSISHAAAGDARSAYNILEAAATLAAQAPGEDGHPHITRSVVEDAAQHRTILYDREGDAHYDTISAFIKSVRGSDPDAALYWLARMLEAGEDPMFVARRLVILAAEDIGLAAPGALQLAVATQQAVHFLGMPEGRLPLAETTVYLAVAPKSNSTYAAYGRALEDAIATRNEPVPLHLRNAATKLMKQFGYGDGYQYAHDYEGHVAPDQKYRPDAVEGHRYYFPGDLGYEARGRS
ncbi:MAG: replication-associated recombination protein A [Dehalococcoidia bacterium]|nr:replication-associated recombination protein A [Dehalococcoidia bacterium]MCA9849029.1 replication-associated recombination protein A [Dehalococcoidia bacterium]MCA9856155.1 replication-associated recombination protein A [Dehalococcoidia bacterium]MCB9491651.1 replication-associated recombination protein A [Dehalococcoidia bacterium]